MKTRPESPYKNLTKKCGAAATLLKALAHPQRLQILCHLSSGEKTVGELKELCGASQSAVSQFLGRMKGEGLVSSIKEGQFVRYRIVDAKVLEIIQALQRAFCE